MKFPSRTSLMLHHPSKQWLFLLLLVVVGLGFIGSGLYDSFHPPEWLAWFDAKVGSVVPLPLDLVEMGMPEDLTGRIVSIEPCPEIASGPGRVVLTTVNHLNPDVWELTVATPDGNLETIHPTGFHKFYFPAKDAWVSACTLKPGDELQGATGPIVVRSLEKLPGVHRVYNMTVEEDHVYRVSLLGALVHNVCAKECASKNSNSRRRNFCD